MVALNQPARRMPIMLRLERARLRAWQWLLDASVPVAALVLLFAFLKVIAGGFLVMKGTGILADLLSQGVALGDTGRIVGLVLEHARGLAWWVCVLFIASSAFRYAVKAAERRNAKQRRTADAAAAADFEDLAVYQVDGIRRAIDHLKRGELTLARHELERTLEG